MPKLDLDAIQATNRTGYPPPFDRPVQGRWYKRLAPVGGLTAFGVSHVVLKPGAWSSQRHWHRNEDEFIYVIEGETLCEDHGETVLKPGEAAGWRANGGIGHCLINRTQKNATYIEVGGRVANETVVYSDIDMRLERDKHGVRYLRKTGEPHPARKT
ncbi:MAG: hypothetical protein QOH86_2187 [Sphingomonadales bacterium]|nr:hypothetical protein [Sphingomonadales bacterium]